MRTGIRLLLFFCCFTLAFASVAQQVVDSPPVSFAPGMGERLGPSIVENVPSLDLDRVRREDQRGPGTRFAAPIAVDMGLAHAGQWAELSGGARLWRLHLRSEGALALATFFDEFYLPPGSTLHMYSPGREQVLGAYTALNKAAQGQFWTGFLYGEEAVLEYYEPVNQRGQGRLHLYRVDYAYHKDNLNADPLAPKSLQMSGFGSAEPCNFNVNCSEGAGLLTQKRGVCRIMLVVAEGTGFCTGTLVNNTANDGRPYVLGAFHCQDGYTPLYHLYRFDFNYESATCANPPLEPAFQSLLGATLRASRQENDFWLVELFNRIPTSFQAYFNGWDRRNLAPLSTSMIHHPAGDLKKVSRSSLTTTIVNTPITWNNDVITPPNHHFRVRLNTGSFEVGSSGAPVFNPMGLVIGQLHGGNATCDAALKEAFVGRLMMSWTGGGTPATRLSNWLNPLGTNQDTLSGIEAPPLVGSELAGIIATETGAPIAKAVVTMVGDFGTRTDTTDASGAYAFTGVTLGEDYLFTVRKNTLPSNGVTTFDLIQIRRHILSLEPLGSPYKLLAADVNASGGISTQDIIRIQQLILSITSAFADVESWYFLPAGFPFANPTSPFAEAGSIEVFLLENFAASNSPINFVGMKMGDVNNSANPQE